MFASNMVCEIGLVLTIQKGMTLVSNSGGIGDKFIRVYHYLNLSLLIWTCVNCFRPDLSFGWDDLRKNEVKSSKYRSSKS